MTNGEGNGLGTAQATPARNRGVRRRGGLGWMGQMGPIGRVGPIGRMGRINVQLRRLQVLGAFAADDSGVSQTRLRRLVPLSAFNGQLSVDWELQIGDCRQGNGVAAFAT
jgi:hypothetical protein